METDMVKWDPFAAMDRLDDEAILAEIEGKIVSTWAYDFSQDGKEVNGLSKKGVDAACAEMAHRGEIIREEDLQFVQDPSSPEHFLFTCRASRFAVKPGEEVKLDSVFGVKRQGIKAFRKSGTAGPDPFWFEKGSMKAARNARMRLLSEEVKSFIVAAAKKAGKVREVKPPSTDTPVERLRKSLFATAHDCKIDDPSLKALVLHVTGKESSKDLSEQELQGLCEVLREIRAGDLTLEEAYKGYGQSKA
jgi:hypothetical protein